MRVTLGQTLAPNSIKKNLNNYFSRVFALTSRYNLRCFFYCECQTNCSDCCDSKRTNLKINKFFIEEWWRKAAIIIAVVTKRPNVTNVSLSCVNVSWVSSPLVDPARLSRSLKKRGAQEHGSTHKKATPLLGLPLFTRPNQVPSTRAVKFPSKLFPR